MSKHTPAPWKVRNKLTQNLVQSADGEELADFSTIEDAEHAVKCVNGYPELEAQVAELVRTLRASDEILNKLLGCIKDETDYRKTTPEHAFIQSKVGELKYLTSRALAKHNKGGA